MFQKQPPKVCCEKKVFLKFGKLHWKTSVMKSLFKKVVGLKTCNFIKKRQVFSCEYCKTFKNVYFEENLRTIT